MKSAFHHIYRPPARDDAPIFLLLHGTGGDESDLIPVAGMLHAEAGILGVRGRVLENGMPRFFRRLSPGVLDEKDLQSRAAELEQFLADAAADYEFERSRIVALGFSNGANIAAAMIWDGLPSFGRAILFRPMLPYREKECSVAGGRRVFIGAGRVDPMVSHDEVESLASRLRAAGAAVAVEWQAAGHNLSPGDVASARGWLTDR